MSNLIQKAGQYFIHISSSSLLNAISNWMAQGASWILSQIGHLMTTTSSPQLNASYMVTELRDMALIALAVGLPLVLIAIIQVIITKDVSSLVKLVILKIPIAFGSAPLAIMLVKMLVSITDSMCLFLQNQGGINLTEIFAKLAKFSLLSLSSGAPSIIVFFISLFLVLSGFTIWFELLFRSAAIEVSVVFLPIALSGVVSSLTNHWIKRLGELIVALIFSKLAIVIVMTLALSQLKAAVSQYSISDLFLGLTIMILATLAPWSLMKIISILDPYVISQLHSTSLDLKSQIKQTARHTANLANKTALLAIDPNTSETSLPTSLNHVSQGDLVPTYQEVLERFNEIGTTNKSSFKKSYTYDISVAPEDTNE